MDFKRSNKLLANNMYMYYSDILCLAYWEGICMYIKFKFNVHVKMILTKTFPKSTTETFYQLKSFIYPYMIRKTKLNNTFLFYKFIFIIQSICNYFNLNVLFTFHKTHYNGPFTRFTVRFTLKTQLNSFLFSARVRICIL